MSLARSLASRLSAGWRAPLFIVLVAAGFACTAPASATEVVLHVDNIRNDRGQVMASLFSNPSTWLDQKRSFQDKSVPSVEGRTTLVFHNVPPGSYGIAVLHDEANKGDMIYSALGLPEEGYAFSQNVRPFLSAPSFSRAAFAVSGSKTVVNIRMVYP